MKIIAFSFLLAAAFSLSGASPCLLDIPGDSPCVSKTFNAKQALFQKFPLLYKLYEAKCKLYCSKINGVTTCYPAPPAPPAPTPVTIVEPPHPAPISYVPAPPACAPAAPLQAELPPEVIRALFGGSLLPEASCPCCS